MSILAFSNLSYSYDKKKNIFCDISAEMELGKIYAILGPSGCGKTTLLSLLGGLDSLAKGKILFNGEDITEKGFANHRRNHVSFIFQAYNLIDYMTPLENVKLTSKLPPEPVLEKMGLTKEEMKRNVLQLSGGQQQRVAIARALASEAPVILADEPTGALDSHSSQMLLSTIQSINEQLGATILMVTHDAFSASYASRILILRDGEIFTELRKGNDSRTMFFEKILSVLTMMGGGQNDVC